MGKKTAVIKIKGAESIYILVILNYNQVKKMIFAKMAQVWKKCGFFIFFNFYL